MKRLKILFLMYSLDTGGIERSLINLLHEIPEDKYEIDLLLLKPYGMFFSQIPHSVNLVKTPNAVYKLTARPGYNGIYIPIKFLGTAISNLITKKRPLQKLYRWRYFYSPFIKNLPNQYDVAISYTNGETAFFTMEKVKAVRKYIWVHNDYKKLGLEKLADIDCFAKANGIVTVSETCLKILNDVFPEFREKCHYIPNITSSKIVKSRAAEFYPIEYLRDIPKFLTIGRLVEQKGFDIAIKAAKIMKQAGFDFVWCVIGSGELKCELDNLIEKNSLQDCFKLLGEKENPYPYIKYCDIYVQPSRFEGKSIAVDEAKILAKPILVTDYPTARDQIEDGLDGVIVPLDVKSIANGIIELWNNKDKICKLVNYLACHDCGNQKEIERYIALIDGDFEQ